jgi:hypothetical protein
MRHIKKQAGVEVKGVMIVRTVGQCAVDFVLLPSSFLRHPLYFSLVVEGVRRS